MERKEQREPGILQILLPTVVFGGTSILSRLIWDRLHTLRVVLNVAGLAFLCLGALRGDDRG